MEMSIFQQFSEVNVIVEGRYIFEAINSRAIISFFVNHQPKHVSTEGILALNMAKSRLAVPKPHQPNI